MLEQLAARDRRAEDAPQRLPEGQSFAEAVRDSFVRPAAISRAEPVPATSGDVINSALRRERTQEDIAITQDREPARDERFTRVLRRVWDPKDSVVREFLLEQYNGRCQLCADTFLKRDGTPYFEGVHLVPYTYAAWTDRPGGVLCLCATCAAKFLHGTAEADDVVEQVLRWRPRIQGGTTAGLTLELCGSPVRLRYTEKHLLDLQVMLQMTSPAAQDAEDRTDLHREPSGC